MPSATKSRRAQPLEFNCAQAVGEQSTRSHWLSRITQLNNSQVQDAEHLEKRRREDRHGIQIPQNQENKCSRYKEDTSKQINRKLQLFSFVLVSKDTILACTQTFRRITAWIRGGQKSSTIVFLLTILRQ